MEYVPHPEDPQNKTLVRRCAWVGSRVFGFGYAIQVSERGRVCVIAGVACVEYSVPGIGLANASAVGLGMKSALLQVKLALFEATA